MFKGIGSMDPYVAIVDEDREYLRTAKRVIESKISHCVVFVADSAVEAMQTVFDIDRRAVFLIRHGLSETDSLALAKHMRNRFRFPSYFFLLIERSDDEVEHKALSDFDIFPIRKYAADGSYNLGKAFIAHLKYGMRHTNHLHADPLTGFLNRDDGLEIWGHDFVRAKRKREAIGCLYVDLDDFKRINDTYGHAAGDEVLVAFSRAIKRCVRNSFDTILRLGGGADEFFIFLPDVNQRTFKEVQSRIRSLAGSVTIQVGKKGVTVYASMGSFLLLPKNMGTDPVVAFEHARKMAETAMYKKKRKKKTSLPHPAV